MRVFYGHEKGIGVIIEYGTVVFALVDAIGEGYHLVIEFFPIDMWESDTMVYLSKYKWYNRMIEEYVDEIVMIDGILNEICKIENYE